MRISLLFCLGVLTACGGQIGQDPADDDRTPNGSDTKDPTSTGTTEGPTGRPAPPHADDPLPASTLSTAGACAEHTPNDFTMVVPGGATCQVKNRVTHPDGSVAIELVSGNLGAATLVDGSVILTCGAQGKLLFEAALRCYDAGGDYTIASGDLVLGNEASDRTCKLGVFDNGTHVSGFISCADDVGASDLFSSNDAPLSLGAFSLPRSF